jgi:hypothetical protein
MSEPGMTTHVDYAQRARRAWRIALVVYLVPVSVLTHWPRLGFAGAGIIDKFVHFIGFGTLAWLFMHAKPWGKASIGFLMGAAWVYLDERTQALEILGRTFSANDMIAGWLGVAMAGFLYWIRRAATPAGSDARADWELAQDMGYASSVAWIRGGLITLASIVVLGAVFVLKQWFSTGEAHLGTYVYAVGFCGFVGLSLAAFGVDLYGRARARAARQGRFVTLARDRMPFWRAGFGIAVIALLLVGYELLLAALFGPDVSEELRYDREGFLQLRQGFLFATVLVGIAASNAVGARAAFRANPSLAARR